MAITLKGISMFRMALCSRAATTNSCGMTMKHREHGMRPTGNPSEWTPWCCRLSTAQSPTQVTLNRQTENCGQLRSVHEWSRQVLSGPVRVGQIRANQVRSPLKNNGIPSLELVAINKPTMKHRENGMRPSGNPGE